MTNYHGLLLRTPLGVMECKYNLRQQILLFDKLIHWNSTILKSYESRMRLINFIGQDDKEYYKDFIETMEYLQDQNIVTDIELNSSFFTDEKYKNLLDEHFYYKKKTDIKIPRDDLNRAKEMAMESGLNLLVADTYATRALAAYSNQISPNIKTVPLLADLYSSDKPNDLKTDMLLITLRKLPLIDSSVPIKTIIEYKRDEKKHLEFLKLINWINSLRKENFSIREFEDHIEYLIAEYENNLKLHKIKYHYSTIQTVTKVAFEFIENVISLKFKSAVETIFDIKRKKVEMILEEKNLHGSEVAYIVSSQNNFK